jgi:hypothetical protein
LTLDLPPEGRNPLGRYGLDLPRCTVPVRVGATDGVTADSLGRELKVATSRIDQYLQRLASTALVEPGPGDGNRRARITPAGVETRTAASRAVLAAAPDFAVPLTPATVAESEHLVRAGDGSA